MDGGPGIALPKVVVLVVLSAGVTSLATTLIAVSKLRDELFEQERDHAFEIAELHAELARGRPRPGRVLTPVEFEAREPAVPEYASARQLPGGTQVLWVGDSVLVLGPAGAWVMADGPGEERLRTLVVGTDGAPPPAPALGRFLLPVEDALESGRLLVLRGDPPRVFEMPEATALLEGARRRLPELLDGRRAVREWTTDLLNSGPPSAPTGSRDA